MKIRERRTKNDMANTLFHIGQGIELIVEEGEIKEHIRKCFQGNIEKYNIQRANALRRGYNIDDLDSRFSGLVESYKQLGGVIQ